MTAARNAFIESRDAKLAKPREEAIEQKGVTPVLRRLWHVLLGIGIFLQETLPIATTVVKSFLFPLHFALDGLRSIWDIYRLARDKRAAHREVKLGANIFNVAGLGVASVLVGLAVTNPFALPGVFLGLVGASIVKDSYLLSQNKKALADVKTEKTAVEAEIRAIKRGIDIATLDGQSEATMHQAQTLRLTRLEAKSKRIDQQLTTLRAERTELRRGMVFHVLSMVAVGLLLSAAVLALTFPPVAIAVMGAGLMLFAAVSITNVLTSPPAVAKMKEGWAWFKRKVGIQENNYEHLPSDDLQAEHDNSGIRKIDPSKPVFSAEAPDVVNVVDDHHDEAIANPMQPLTNNLDGQEIRSESVGAGVMSPESDSLSSRTALPTPQYIHVETKEDEVSIDVSRAASLPIQQSATNVIPFQSPSASLGNPLAAFDAKMRKGSGVIDGRQILDNVSGSQRRKSF